MQEGQLLIKITKKRKKLRPPKANVQMVKLLMRVSCNINEEKQFYLLNYLFELINTLITSL